MEAFSRSWSRCSHFILSFLTPRRSHSAGDSLTFFYSLNKHRTCPHRPRRTASAALRCASCPLWAPCCPPGWSDTPGRVAASSSRCCSSPGRAQTWFIVACRATRCIALQKKEACCCYVQQMANIKNMAPLKHNKIFTVWNQKIKTLKQQLHWNTHALDTLDWWPK